MAKITKTEKYLLLIQAICNAPKLIINSLLALLLLSIVRDGSLEASTWLCKEAASEKNGNILTTCGIGEGLSESIAREKALNAAYIELDLICSKSPDCNNFELNLKPLRNDCNKMPNGEFKCFRGVESTILTKKRDSNIPRFFANPEKIIIPINNQIVQVDEKSIERSLVKFETLPEGVTVTINKIETCQTPCSRELQYGKFEIKYHKDQYEEITEVIQVPMNHKTLPLKMIEKVGWLELQNIPLGSVVKVNDIIKTELKINLLPGNYGVTVYHENYQPFIQEISIKKGKIEKVNFNSEAIFGWLDITSVDSKGNSLDANILVDDKLYKELTPAKIKVHAGSRKIILKYNNLISEETLNVKNNETLRMKKTLRIKENEKNLDLYNISSKDLLRELKESEKKTKVNPGNKDPFIKVEEIKSILESRARKLYREAIIAESLSLFDNSKKYFKEVVSISPKNSEYYKKSIEKLKNYED